MSKLKSARFLSKLILIELIIMIVLITVIILVLFKQFDTGNEIQLLSSIVIYLHTIFGLLLILLIVSGYQYIKVSQAEARESGERFQATFEQAAVGIAYVTPDGRFLRINQKFCDIVGYLHDEMLKITIKDITHPEDLNSDLINLQKILEEEIDTYSIEKRYIHKNGDTTWIYLTVSLVRDEEKQAAWFIYVVKDINELKHIENELALSESKYRNLVDNSIVGVFTSTIDGQFLFVNQAMVDMFEFEDVDQMISEGSIARWADPNKRREFIERIKEHGEVINFEAESITKDGRHKHVIFSVKLQYELIQGMVMDITEKKVVEQKVTEYQEKLKDLANELINSEEKQRRQIAVDLHDHVGQILASSRLQISTVSKSINDKHIQDKLKNISNGLNESIDITRKVIFELSPPQLNEIGLAAALSDWMQKELKVKHGIECEIKADSEKYPLSSELRYLLFRSVRELLNNVIKHSDAKNVDVIINYQNSILSISVNDNGKGFSYIPDLLRMRDTGFGLLSITERIESIEGELLVDTSPGKGTTATLRLPIRNKVKV